MAQRKRIGPITQGSVDRNYQSLATQLFNTLLGVIKEPLWKKLLTKPSSWWEMPSTSETTRLYFPRLIVDSILRWADYTCILRWVWEIVLKGKTVASFGTIVRNWSGVSIEPEAPAWQAEILPLNQ